MSLLRRPVSGEMWQLLSFTFFNFKGNEGGEGDVYINPIKVPMTLPLKGYKVNLLRF